jgi:GDPmannose 4,6-dehydratase
MVEHVKKALIIGISGQDGAYLSDSLLKKNYKVYGTSRDVHIKSFRNLEKLGIADKVELLSMAISDFRSVIQGIINSGPDEIYNLAGQSSVGLSFEQPVEAFDSICLASLNILESIRLLSKPIKFYSAASSECFGNTTKPANENTPFHPRSPYATAKAGAFWMASNYREAYDIYACNGILFNHESPLRPQRFVTQKIVDGACKIAKGSRDNLLLGNIDINRDWGWAPDYVEAMWLMLQQDQPDDYIIATGETNSLIDFIDVVFSHLGLDWKKHVESKSELCRPSDINISMADPSKAKNKLGWQARYKMRDVAKMMVEDFLGYSLDK